jgi:hypothetical protein
MATQAAMVAELKQQGAFEAAADPNSSITAEDAQKKAEIETKKAGALGLTFDPDATPEQKAAQARNVCTLQASLNLRLLTLLQHLPDGFHHEHKPKGVAIATDIDDGTPGAYDLPEASTAGALAAPVAKKDKDGKAIPGAMTEDDEDRWVSKTGWAPRFGNGDPKNDEGPSMLDHQTWVEGKLADKFFGGKMPPFNGPSSEFTNNRFRLVSQYWCHYFCLPRFVACSCSGRRFGLGLHYHGHLRDILSNFNTARATKLSG